ncbi:MAG: LuxR C-terminal-related transcriptional regulator [Thermomicrobiales bacterium]
MITAESAHAALAAPFTSLVGRQREIAEVTALLCRDEVRLVTLTGPGGVGKTRLALAVTDGLGRQFPGGTRAVALAAVTDIARLTPTIAQTLRVRDSGEAPLAEQIAATLGNARTLLLLDNLEQLPEPAPQIAALLHACPDLTILATSRTRLRVSGEHLFGVPPLAAAAANGAGVSAERVAASDAGTLFTARAQAARADFTLTAGNVAAVVALCARVDHLPLGIELAAAHMRHYAPEALLRRLEPRLPMLEDGPQDQPARLQTMHQAIQWGYDLMAPPMRALYQRLAVFSGSASLEAAEAVAAATGCDGDLRAQIHALADASMAQIVTIGGEPRVRLLETIREFGLMQLAASGEDHAVRDAHAAYFLSLVVATDRAHPESRQDIAHVPDLSPDQDNLRGALAWLEQSRQYTQMLRLAVSAAWLWDRLALYRESADRIQQALTLAGEGAPAADRMRAWRRLESHSTNMGDHERALTFGEMGLQIARESGDVNGMGWALIGLAVVSERLNQLERSGEFHQEALACFRQAGNPYGLAQVLGNLGDWAFHIGDDAQARVWSSEALEVSRGLADQRYLTGALNGLGQVALAEHDAGAAADVYLESLRVSLEIGDAMGVAQALAGLAGVAVEQQHPALGVRWLAAARSYLVSLGAGTIANETQFERALNRATALLTTAQFTVAWAGGWSLAISEATDEAMTSVTELRGAAEELGAGTLSPREHEVLRYLVAGRSDPAIAAELHIGRRTVQTHVGAILRKLRAANRTEAAAVALRAGLI